MTTQTGFVTGQTTVGDEAREQQHDHPAELHTHDHYHVTHHHTGGPLGEFEHRASYHTHQHNHAPLVHAHANEPAKEETEHGKEAHPTTTTSRLATGARPRRLGYALSSDEHAPAELVRHAVPAEEAGLQGHSSLVWRLLGGIARETSGIEVGKSKKKDS